MEPMSSDEVLQGQALLWNLSFSFLKPMALKWALDLAVPDILARHGASGATISDIAAALSVPPARSGALSRLMRALVEMGVFATLPTSPEKKKEETLYLLTPSSRLLLKDERLEISEFLNLHFHPVVSDPWRSVSDWFKRGRYATILEEHNDGKGMWEIAGESPEFNGVFNRGMACDSRIAADVLVGGSGELFRGVGSMVDVGGGVGAMALAVAAAFPETECIVLDLPHVVDSVPEEERGRVKFIAGDMFVEVPKAQVALLKLVLHDWNDEECVAILKKCKEAIPGKDDGGKVIIVEMVVGAASAAVGGDKSSLETQLLYDLVLMEVTHGMERDEEQWSALFKAAGFSGYKYTPLLGLRSVIELFP